MKLTEQERNSELWTKIKAYLEERIERHRATNDNTQSLEETEKLRGRIAELKDLMKIETPSIKVNKEY